MDDGFGFLDDGSLRIPDPDAFPPPASMSPKKGGGCSGDCGGSSATSVADADVVDSIFDEPCCSSCAMGWPCDGTCGGKCGQERPEEHCCPSCMMGWPCDRMRGARRHRPGPASTRDTRLLLLETLGEDARGLVEVAMTMTDALADKPNENVLGDYLRKAQQAVRGIDSDRVRQWYSIVVALQLQESRLPSCLDLSAAAKDLVESGGGLPDSASATTVETFCVVYGSAVASICLRALGLSPIAITTCLLTGLTVTLWCQAYVTQFITCRCMDCLPTGKEVFYKPTVESVVEQCCCEHHCSVSGKLRYMYGVVRTARDLRGDPVKYCDCASMPQELVTYDSYQQKYTEGCPYQTVSKELCVLANCSPGRG